MNDQKKRREKSEFGGCREAIYTLASGGSDQPMVATKLRHQRKVRMTTALKKPPASAQRKGSVFRRVAAMAKWDLADVLALRLRNPWRQQPTSPIWSRTQTETSRFKNAIILLCSKLFVSTDSKSLNTITVFLYCEFTIYNCASGFTTSKYAHLGLSLNLNLNLNLNLRALHTNGSYPIIIFSAI